MKSPRKTFVLEGDRILLDTQPSQHAVPGPASYQTQKYKKALTEVGVAPFGRTVRLTGQWCRDEDPHAPAVHVATTSSRESPAEVSSRRSRSSSRAPSRQHSVSVPPETKEGDMEIPRRILKRDSSNDSREPQATRYRALSRLERSGQSAASAEKPAGGGAPVWETESSENKIHLGFQRSLRRWSGPRGSRQRPQSMPPQIKAAAAAARGK